MHAVRLAQAALGALAVAGTFVLGRQLVRPAVGIVAGAISAVYPFFIYYSGQVLTETLFMALVVWLFVAGFWAVERRTVLLPALRRNRRPRDALPGGDLPLRPPLRPLVRLAHLQAPRRRLRLAAVAGAPCWR